MKIGIRELVRNSNILDGYDYLEEIVKKENCTQTDVIKSIIEEKYEKYSIQVKLEAFDRLKGCMIGLIGDDVSIQSIKLEMGSQL